MKDSDFLELPTTRLLTLLIEWAEQSLYSYSCWEIWQKWKILVMQQPFCYSSFFIIIWLNFYFICLFYSRDHGGETEKIMTSNMPLLST